MGIFSSFFVLLGFKVKIPQSHSVSTGGHFYQKIFADFFSFRNVEICLIQLQELMTNSLVCHEIIPNAVNELILLPAFFNAL